MENPFEVAISIFFISFWVIFTLGMLYVTTDFKRSNRPSLRRRAAVPSFRHGHHQPLIMRS